MVVNLKLDEVNWARPGYFDLDLQVDWAGPDSPAQAARPGDLQLWVPIIAMPTSRLDCHLQTRQKTGIE